MRKYLPYHLGLIIPTTIITVNGATTWFSVIMYDSDSTRLKFLFAYGLVWLSYALAVLVRPGYTDGTEYEGGLYVDCTKCHRPKPERAHHCRICKRCVLRMDHHCPWTENCVGERNMGHFMRFLGYAALLNLYGCYRTGGFLIYIYRHSRYWRRILPNSSRIWLALGGMCGTFLIFMTLMALWLRVLTDVVQGRTQIESWEHERAEALSRKKLGPAVDFPFDIGIITNLVSALGSPLFWAFPWGASSGNGHIFEKLFPSGRWPPQDSSEVRQHEYYRADRWVSFEGEKLEDMGVDNDDVAPFQMNSGEASITATEIADDDMKLSEVQRRLKRDQ